MDARLPRRTRTASSPTLLAVWAHPDDESFLAAGLMAELADAGGRVVCAFATRGDRGAPSSSLLTPAGVARARTAEARRSLEVLGVHEVRFLGHGDGTCATVDPADGMGQVGRLIEEVRPDTIVTFGSDGITGHPDHRAVSAWTIGAWAHTTVRPRPQVLCAATTGAFLDRHAALHDEVQLFQLGRPRRTAEDEVVRRVRLEGSRLDRKLSSLAAHASQTTTLRHQVGDDVFRTWWAEETFRAPTADEVAAATAPVAA